MNWELPLADTYFRKILESTPKGFEIDHLEKALTYCKKFRTAVDVGAHIGTWSVNMANRFKTVMAFEPAPDTFRCLQVNTKPYSNIWPISAAVGSRRGSCLVINDETRLGNTGARMVSEEGDFSLGKVRVDTIDSYAIATLDFLKIDVEGYEIEVLKGAVRTLDISNPVLVVECKQFNPPRNGGTEAVRKFLKKLRYREVDGIRNDRVFVR